jgi:aminomethyltransferase
VARTGYTGEDGWEIILPGAQAAAPGGAGWPPGVRPCGLGARDTLRLEAGMNLYGQDMDENTSPLESALGWTVAWEPAERDFIGRARWKRSAPPGRGASSSGLLLEDKGVLRAHQKGRRRGRRRRDHQRHLLPDAGALHRLARVPAAAGERVQVEVRGRLLEARVVRPPVRAARQAAHPDRLRRPKNHLNRHSRGQP